MSNEEALPSRQEMFNRAWTGLKSQGWATAFEGSQCTYLTATGLRCAWGWVDPEGTVWPDGRPKLEGCWMLHFQPPSCGGGLARLLSDEDAEWACTLQNVHDKVATHHPKVNGRTLEEVMRAFATDWGLSVPEEP